MDKRAEGKNELKKIFGIKIYLNMFALELKKTFMFFS